MDTTQDLTQVEQPNQEEKTALSAFFDDCNEEERKIINEFSQIQGITLANKNMINLIREATLRCNIF